MRSSFMLLCRVSGCFGPGAWRQFFVHAETPPSCPAHPAAARGALGWRRRVKGGMLRVSLKAEEAGRQPGAAPYKEMGLAA